LRKSQRDKEKLLIGEGLGGGVRREIFKKFFCEGEV
jgi:hypothetical protein